MNEKTDLRIIKTKQKLVDAFTDMIDKIPFTDISVYELCQNANVRRATFYKHFSDKFDFLRYYVKLLEEEIFTSTSPLKRTRAPIDYYASYVSHIIQYLNYNEKIIQALVGTEDFFNVLNIILSGTYDVLIRDLTEDVSRGVIILPSEIETVARFLNGGIGALVVEWFFNKRISEDEMISRIKKIIEAIIL